MTLLDSLGKRMKWLEEILPQLGVPRPVRHRPGRRKRRRNGGNATITPSPARVARLNILLELTAPYVKVGGAVLAMKGSAAGEELAECTSAIKKLGLTTGIGKGISPLTGRPTRSSSLRKTAPTPKQYPRRYAKIKQSPL